MTYQKAQEALANGLLAKREKWPDSTWLSPRFEGDGKTLFDVKVRYENRFNRDGVYGFWLPTEEDRNATDWVCRPS